MATVKGTNIEGAVVREGGTPVDPEDLVTKAYVDGADVIHESCKVIAAVPLPNTPTFTPPMIISSVLTPLIIDSVTISVVGTRVLVAGETGGNTAHKGIYRLLIAGIAGGGEGGTAWVLTRDDDWDTGATYEAGEGCGISEGTLYADTIWQTQASGTVGSSSPTFEQGSASVAYVNAADALKVAKAGDTMTGNLGISKATPQLNLTNTTNGQLLTLESKVVGTDKTLFLGGTIVTPTTFGQALNLVDGKKVVGAGYSLGSWTLLFYHKAADVGVWAVGPIWTRTGDTTVCSGTIVHMGAAADSSNLYACARNSGGTMTTCRFDQVAGAQIMGGYNRYAITYNAGTGAFLGYCNGVGMSSAGVHGYAPTTLSDNMFRIGINEPGYGSNAELEEVAIFNTVLTPTQIANDYAAYSPLVGTESGLVALWHFDGDYTEEVSANTLTADAGVTFIAGMGATVLTPMDVIEVLDGTAAGERGYAKYGDAYSRTVLRGKTIEVVASGTTCLSADATGLLDAHSNRVTAVGAPTGATDAATKAYVDGASLLREACKMMTTIALPACTYAAVTGNGTLTADAPGALTTTYTDGVTPVVLDRFLVANQATTANNGIYSITTVGDGGTAWVLTRVNDWKHGDAFTQGEGVSIEQGTVNADTIWACEASGTVGTDDPDFDQKSASQAWAAAQLALKLSLSGGTMSGELINKVALTVKDSTAAVGGSMAKSLTSNEFSLSTELIASGLLGTALRMSAQAGGWGKTSTCPDALIGANWAISMWFNTNGEANGGLFAWTEATSGEASFGFLLGTNLYVGYNDGGTFKDKVVTHGITMGSTWHHLVVTHSAANVIHAYIDTVDFTLSANVTRTAGPAGRIAIGYGGTILGRNEFTQVSINDVRIYNAVIGQSVVDDIYNSTLGTESEAGDLGTNLILHWLMNEPGTPVTAAATFGHGEGVYDLSPNSGTFVSVSAAGIPVSRTVFKSIDANEIGETSQTYIGDEAGGNVLQGYWAGLTTNGVSRLRVESDGTMKVNSGTNCAVGQTTLVGGTKTVANTLVTALSQIFLTVVGTAAGRISLGTIVPGVSFDINSTEAADTNVVNWWIIEPM